MTDFQKGYEKALQDCKDKFNSVDTDNYTARFVAEVFNQLKQESTTSIKPVIFFTRLDKKGNLEFDREKTEFYAEHPAEMKPAKPAKPAKAPRAVEVPKLSTVSKGSIFEKTLDELTHGKTVEMCKAENEVSLGGQLRVDDDVDPIYLNALIQQISFLARNPVAMHAMLAACHIDQYERVDNAIQLVLDYMTATKSLFSFKS